MESVLVVYAPFIMFLILLVLLGLSTPVAFALLATALSFGWFYLGPTGVNIAFNGFWSTMNNWALVALPMFIFMSALLERCRLAEDAFLAVYRLLAPVRGSLAVVAVVLGVLIGAMSGVAAAGVVTLAVLLYPLMKKYRYDESLAIGSIVCAGSLPILIPPSIALIIYGAITGVPVGKLFAGGLVLGGVVSILFSIYILAYCFVYKDAGPRLPPEEAGTVKERLLNLKYAIGPLAIIFGTLGSIFTGMATPTEASAVGALATLIYAIFRRRLDYAALKDSLISTIKITTFACWMAAGSGAFSKVFVALGGKTILTDFFNSLPGGSTSALIVSILFVLFLGMFLELIGLVTLAAPILSPVIVSLGYDPLWWGLMFNLAVIAGLFTPPVGPSAYFFKGVYPEIPIARIFRSLLPFLVIYLGVVVLFGVYPEAFMNLIRLIYRT